MRLGGLGERFNSPSGSGRSPAAKRYLVNFRLIISPLVATNFRSFSGNETSNYDRHVGCLLVAFSQKLRGSALIINALPPKFLQKRFPPYFFHGAFAPLFIWSRRTCIGRKIMRFGAVTPNQWVISHFDFCRDQRLRPKLNLRTQLWS